MAPGSGWSPATTDPANSTLRMITTTAPRQVARVCGYYGQYVYHT